MDCFRIFRWLGLNETKRPLNISSQRLLKARLAKLRREVLTPKSGGGGPGEGFNVAKTGDARIGFVGKSHHRPSIK
jgi:ribosome-interacting GTPase 1